MLSRSHRTAVFVDGDGLNSTPAYRERINRLNQSVNGDNIKVDFFTVGPVTGTSSITPGIVVPGVPKSPKLTVEDLQAEARAAGYDVALVALNVKG